MSEPEIPDHIRQHLALALDVDDLVAASRLARELKPWFGVAKVGLELFSAAGPEAFGVLQDMGYAVFADLKLHDIPTTVGRASRVLGALGVRYVTMHAHGDVAMLSAGVEGLNEGATNAGLLPPVAVAVTVLTSDRDAPPHIIPKRVRAAMEAGCGGIVCAGTDLDDVRSLAPRMHKVVPGIRPAGASSDDQARVATPRQAIDAGADLLVVGRAVTASDDRLAAAAAIAAELSD
ncbi:MAG: orotidine-5'-phosphate decarboxylase [Acidimicrobiia bacterium]|nr:orotidine-5'-phosphate decarboxylase [Acidimicrobiia bacterium]